MNKNYKYVNIPDRVLTPRELRQSASFDNYEKSVFFEINCMMIRSYTNFGKSYQEAILSGEERFQVDLGSVKTIAAILFWNNNFF